MTMNIQQAANAIALTKVTTPPTARDILTPGEYKINHQISVEGYIRVGEDGKYTPTVAIPMVETLALFIHYSGITGPHAAATLVKAMQISLMKDGTGAGAIAAYKPIITASEKTVRDLIISKLPQLPRKGAVTGNIVARELAVV